MISCNEGVKSLSKPESSASFSVALPISSAIDRRIAKIQARRAKPKPFDMGQFLSRQFNFVYVAFSIGFLLFTFSPQLQLGLGARFCWILGAFLLDLLVVQGAKHVFYAPRPNYPNVWKWGRHPHSGFPSGHSVPAFMLATMVLQATPVLAPIWFVGATLIAFGRWKVEAHYAWQVSLSAILGVLIALFSRSLVG